MPMYEYECENCGTRFDRIQSINDEPVRQCPECAGAVHKVFHAAGLIFKGSGWYITDSRKATSGAVTGETKPASGDGAPAESGAKTEVKADATAVTKTETKSETKPAPK